MAIEFNVDSQVRPYANVGAFPVTGSVKTLYIDESTSDLYYWDGSAYAIVKSQSKYEAIDAINGTGATVLKMSVCYLKTSSSSANTPELLLSNASTEATSSKTIGLLLQDLANGATGKIITSGEYDKFDTSAYNVGDRLWLSTTDGQVTTTIPSAPTHAVFIGFVTRKQSQNGRILVSIQNGYELREIHDVSLPTTPLDGQVLAYDSPTSLWKAKTISTGITIGTTAITSGTVGRVLFEGTGNVVSESANLFWDNTNGRLGIGTSTPSTTLSVSGIVSIVNSVGTNRSTQLTSGLSSDNFSAVAFYPLTGTNVGQSFQVIPKGTGFSAGIKAQFSIFGTDLIADGTNFEALVVRATGSAFTFSSGKGGTGTIRPMLFSSGFLDGVTNPNQLWLYTTGNIGINTTTDAGFRLDVNGTTRVVGDATINTVKIGLGGGAVASNTALGYQALNLNSTGARNVGVGYQANFTNSGAGDNTAIGYQAMYLNTANHNTAVGSSALYSNTGNHNSAFGRNSLVSNTSGAQNTGIGRDSLSANTTGSDNSALGYQTVSGNFSGSTILGRGATATANNQFVVGSTGTNAGSVTTEVNASTQVWNVIINGVARKILLA